MAHVLDKDFTVEEGEGIEGLVLGRGRDGEVFGDIGEELADFFCAHFLWVSFMMEEDKASDPVDIRFDSTRAQVFEGGGCADAVEEFWFRCFSHIPSPLFAVLGTRCGSIAAF